ncbi:MAG TPA: hypothetical protein VFV74_07285 [Burkholderiales bacterium]|nr:hypothetical protein [Burkholderiales bacterium]
MLDVRTGLNALGIFAASSFVIFYFDLSLLWYSAALLAWLIRRQWVYHAGPAADASHKEPGPEEADQTAENL